VPSTIIEGLRGEGFDVRAFRPAAVNAADVAESRRVVMIGTTLPASARRPGVPVEQWDDVPPASTNYTASGDVLRAHVATLIEQLAAARSQ
jgi:hypothetical protein